MHVRRTRKRSDSGVVAIVVAIAAVLIFSLAAFAVDLGNAYARKRDIQTQADLAALAAAVRLPVMSEADKDAVEGVVDQWAKQNLVLGQKAADAALWNFTDALKENGYVEFVGAEKIRVITPEARVDFGLANAMGFSGIDVAGVAAVEIRSPGPGPMPFYASLGCNLGLQIISEEPSPPPPAPTSELPTTYTNHSNGAVVSSIEPAQVALDSGPQSVVVNGNGFQPSGSNPDQLFAVGFFRGAAEKPTTTYTVQSNTKITGVAVPADVLSTAGTWYVRVQMGQNVNGAKWSAHPGAPFKVVDPNPPPPPTPGWTTTCPAGAQAGNFGTIVLPRNDIDSMWVEANIALGVVPGLGFEHYPGSPDVGDPQCYTTDPQPPTVISENKHDIESETNCLESDPGFPGAEVTAGYIAGFDEREPDVPGLLDVDTTKDPDETGTCAPDGISGQVNTTVKQYGNGGHVSINNDVLSCFITNPSVTVGQITQSGSLAAPVKHVLSPAIFDSPRFMWVPLFRSAADNGRKYYKLIGFQPGFLTDQPPTATSGNRATGADTANGIKYSVNASGSTVIQSIKVIFFNPEAMPDSIASREPTWEYTGVGTKVPVLVE